MRKCKARWWIPAEWIDITDGHIPARQLKEGTRCYSEYHEVMFHGWGLDIDETASYSIGIVEDKEGKCHMAPVADITFLEPIKEQL